MFKTLAYAHKVTFKLVFCYFSSVRKKKGNELPSLPSANLPYKEESEWLDRLFDSFLQEKISLDDLKKGVALVFHSYGKKVRREIRNRLKAELRTEQLKAEARSAGGWTNMEDKSLRGRGSMTQGLAVEDILVLKTTCPSCGGDTLRVSAPYEVWVHCAKCGYTDSYNPGSEEWGKYVDMALRRQLALSGGGC